MLVFRVFEGGLVAKHLVRVKLRLVHVRPFVTRVFDMHSTSTLGELHLAIQAVMPWGESHLHEFQVQGASYVDPSHGWDECDGDEELYDQDSTTLGALIRSGCDRFNYVYDLGDNWVHSIALSRAGSEVAGITYPHLVSGARACPLEDCGGPGGHERLLAALRGDAHADDSDKDETASLLKWADKFDPEVFDAVDAQARLDMTFGHGPAVSRGWGDWREPFRFGGHKGAGRSNAIAASLAQDLPAERFSGAPFIRDAALMLQMFAAEPAPVTKTGALTVKSVLRVCDAMSVELYDRSAVRSEADIPWIEVLHIVLDVAGLMRRRGNVLAPTPRGMLLADPKRRAELAATLLRTRFEEFSLAYGSYGGEAPRLQDEYRATLSLLRKCARDWVSIDDIWRDAVTDAAKTQCVHAFAPNPQSLVEHRLIRPFMEMGLLEARDLRGTEGGPRFRCAPLLDEWVHFDAR